MWELLLMGLASGCVVGWYLGGEHERRMQAAYRRERRRLRPRRVSLSRAVLTRLHYEAILREEPVERTVPVMTWRGLVFTDRARAGWEIVFERPDEEEEDGVRRELLEWTP